MNKDNLVLKDKVNIIPYKKCSSEMNLKKEKSLIDYKTIFQSDNFSFLKEKENFLYSKKINFNEKISLNKKFFTQEITNTQNNYNDCLILYDKYMEVNSKNEYEIIFPERNSKFFVGSFVYFECCLITDNELQEEEFDDLIWVSNIDGLIGVKNKFKTMLSCGKHVISLIKLENQIELIKDKIEVSVVIRESDLPEIDR